jgi:RNA polymerase sigma factor for flagellar operon FliA
MLDALRESDPGTRRVRREMRRVEIELHRLSHQLGRAPLESEIAEALEISLPAYQRLLMEAHGYRLLLIDDFAESDPESQFLDWCAQTSSDPLAALERKSLQRTLLVALSDLSANEQQVMTMYYVEEATMKDIGLRLGVSESRVSQIHTQAIAKLRAEVVCPEDQPSLLAPRRRAA